MKEFRIKYRLCEEGGGKSESEAKRHKKETCPRNYYTTKTGDKIIHV